MDKAIVFNDTHIGTLRSAGTTPTSAYELRRYILTEFREQLFETHSADIIHLGDLFDNGSIPLSDLLQAYDIVRSFLAERDTTKFYAVRGNHDITKSSANMSSFDFFCKLLSGEFPYRFIPVTEPMITPHGYIIPHLVNQEAFDAALAQTPPCNVLYLHCNIDNPFTQHSDHSLGTTSKALAKLPIKAVVCAHEHQKRKAGIVTIPGNQIPTSIADCLNCDGKYATAVEEGGRVVLLKILDANEIYIEQDWKDLTPTDHKFVRIVGTAKPEEAVAMTEAIANFRKLVDAFVVANAVNVEGEDVDAADFQKSLEAVRGFNVLEALREILSKEEMEVLEGLSK